MTSPRMILFELNHTTNPYRAAYLADQLGASVIASNPTVALPIDWVAEKATGAVDLAIFAINHCADPETLLALSRRERRITVLHALVANLATPLVALEELQRRIPDRARELQRAYDNVRVVPPTDEERLAAYREKIPNVIGQSANDFSRSLYNITSLAAVAPNLLEELLRTQAESTSTSIATLLLRERYITASSNKELWASITLSDVEVLDLYPASSRRKILRTLIQEVLQSHAPLVPLSAELTRLVLSGVDPETVGVPERDKFLARFSDQSVALIISDPRWHWLLSTQRLSDEQFAALTQKIPQDLTTLPTAYYPQLFKCLEGSLTRLQLVLTRLQEHPAGLAPTSISAALRCLDVPNSEITNPLFMQYATPEVLPGFIAGTYCVASLKMGGTPILPSREQLVSLLPSLSEQVLHTLELNCVDLLRRATLPADYNEILIEAIPGLAFAVMNDKAWTDYVYQRLSAYGPDEQVLVYFDEAQPVALRGACEDLAARSIAAS